MFNILTSFNAAHQWESIRRVAVEQYCHLFVASLSGSLKCNVPERKQREKMDEAKVAVRELLSKPQTRILSKRAINTQKARMFNSAA